MQRCRWHSAVLITGQKQERPNDVSGQNGESGGKKKSQAKSVETEENRRGLQQTQLGDRGKAEKSVTVSA